jgi:hypothetical protein
MSNRKLNLGTRLQGSTPFLEIQSFNSDNFTFDANSQVNLADSLVINDLTLNGNFINNGGGSIGGASAEYTTSVTTPKIIFTDNLAEGLIIESSDGADYIVCNSTNGSEQINLKKKIFTDGNQLVCGTNGSRGILQYGNIKNSTIDNTNTLSANTTGTSSAWSSTMRLDISNPYTAQLMSFINFDGTTDKELPIYYIDESNSNSHRFVLQNTEAGHSSSNLQTKIEFLNQYHPSLARVDKRMAELISTTDNFSTLIYDSQSQSNYSQFSLSYDKPDDIPSIGNFVFFDTRSNGERIMRLENRFLQYDSTTQEKQYATSIHLCNAGDFRDDVVEDEIAKIKANWRADGQGELRLLARRTASSSAQECGLLITDSAGGNVIQGYQNANNMVISGQQIDGFCDIKYFNGCAIGNSSHLGNGLEYKDSGGSVISGASVGYDNTLELKLADSTLQTSGSGLSVKFSGSSGLQEATGNAGLELKLKTGGGLDVDGNGLFVTGGASSDEIIDADSDTYIKVEETTDDDTISFVSAGTKAMTIRSNQKVIIGDATLDNAKCNIQRTRPAYNAFNDIRDYYLQMGGSESGLNTRVAMGFGKISANTNYPPAHILFEESSNTGDTQGRLLLGARTSTTGTDIPPNTLSIYNDFVGVGVDSPSYKMDIRSDNSNDLFRLIGGTGAPSFEIESGSSNVSLKTNSGSNALTLTHASTPKIGIGTTSPAYRLTVIGYDYSSAGKHVQISYAETASRWPYVGWTSVSSWYGNMSAWFSHDITAGAYWLRSDKRIKKDFSLIKDDIALKQVNQLESYEYNYIDPLKQKENKTIGFIAQNVKEIIPNACSLQNDYIPDEMRLLNEPQWEQIENDKYKLTISDLDLSDNHTGNCRFYVSDDPSGNDEVCKEIMVEDDKQSFIFDKKWNNVYFYGKEVDDFHVIDKAQIFALHHSAIQELSRKNDLLETENNSLLERTQVAEDRISSLETLLADLSRRVAINEKTLHGLIN